MTSYFPRPIPSACALLLALGCHAAVLAQPAAKPAASVPAAAAAAAKPDAHAQKDIARHRALAAAHEAAARCLEAGTPEAQCQEKLREACKGLAIGRYCGMRHEH